MPGDARFSAYRSSDISLTTHDARPLQASPTQDSRREHYNALGEFRSEYLNQRLRSNNSAAVAAWQSRDPQERILGLALHSSLEGHELRELRHRDLENPLLTATQDFGAGDGSLQSPGEVDAFQRFQQRGTLFDDASQPEKRVLRIEKNGILRYESKPRSPEKAQAPEAHARSPAATTTVRPSQRGADKADFWERFKDRVLHDLQHGTITNKRKKKKVEAAVEAEPEVDCLLHTKVHSVYQLLDAFRPPERAEVVKALLDFSFSKDKGSFLVTEIGRIQGLMEQGHADDFDKHMILVYKFLFKKRVETTTTKARVAEFGEA